jgi:hypothetical protein
MKEKSDSEKGQRFNEGKLKWSLVHFKSLEPMVRVLMFGAKKYSPNQWKKGLNKTEILESMQRHLAALMDGEEVDIESGKAISGISNAMRCSITLWWIKRSQRSNNIVLKSEIRN